MASLEQTTAAFAELPASLSSGLGFHSGHLLKVAGRGLMAFEMDYDETLHEPHMINPYSMNQYMDGSKKVAVSVPDRPLAVNIVVHQPDSSAREDQFRYGENRRWLGRQIGRAVTQSILDSGMTDYVQLYAIGKRASEFRDPGVEVLSTSGNSLKEAAKIDELRDEDLTIVISDFLHLPITPATAKKNHDFEPTMAIKVNIPHDIGLDTGRLVLRNDQSGHESDLSSSHDLAVVNKALHNLHMTTMKRLGQAGCSVASIILDTNNKGGFDVTETDSRIATAVKALCVE